MWMRKRQKRRRRWKDGKVWLGVVCKCDSDQWNTEVVRLM